MNRLLVSSLVDLCCLTVAIQFKNVKLEKKELLEAIRECGLPVELHDLLVKFCCAVSYFNTI